MNNILKEVIQYNWTQYGYDGDMKICEIGSRQGSSTALLGLYAKLYNGKVYSYDNYNSDSLGIVGNYLNIREIFLKHIKNLQLENYIEQFPISSEEGVKNITDESIDFLFIDGNHLYKNIKEDIELWFPKIKNGGIICGHDCELIANSFQIDTIKASIGLKNCKYTWDTEDMIIFHLGVVVAVSEIFPNANIIGNRIWWVKK